MSFCDGIVIVATIRFKLWVKFIVSLIGDNAALYTLLAPIRAKTHVSWFLVENPYNHSRNAPKMERSFLGSAIFAVIVAMNHGIIKLCVWMNCCVYYLARICADQNNAVL